MAKKPETRFKERIRPLLEALPNSWWVKTQQVAVKGIPDFLGCINGHFVALELKAREEDEADELQKWNLKRIVNAGGISIVVYPEIWDSIFSTLQSIAKGKASYKPTVRFPPQREDS